ncbi:hypothetical protein FGG08_001124 [Glutinoglossum americanum]|uniref:NACHT domain-containing protein n=1 Tax=Glutinoglossum americanum TaxID=1670608 RepID=A0A9P8I8V7_9PEZI|nr:hypothetical protein FGG08_001124 [Glutinoglossum americanum]
MSEGAEWKAATQSHLSRLDPQLRACFEASTDADSAISVSRRSDYVVGARFRFLKRPLDRFGGVVDVLTQTNSGVGSPIWAPLATACLLCRGHGDLMGKIREFVVRILSSVDRISRYEVVFETDASVRSAIGMLYSDYVDFFVRIAIFARESFLRELMFTFDDEFQQVTDALKVHEAAVDFAANALKSQTLSQQDTQRRDLMRWIAGPTAVDEDLRKLRALRMHSSCDWFLKSSIVYVENWLKVPVSSVPHPFDLISVQGDPGTGKSVLASAIVDHLLELYRGSTVPVLYFFCREEHMEKRTSLPILKSLVSQLLVQQPHLSLHFEDIYRKSGQAPVESFYALLPAFLNAMANCPLSYIVIDAINECDMDSQNQFVEASSIWESGPPFARMRLLFTSRFDLTIEKGWYLRGRLAVTTDFRNSPSSIESYVKKRLNKSASSQSPGSKIFGELDLVRTICNCARENWLVAALTLDTILKAKSIAAARRKLEALRCGTGPIKLSNLIRNILLQLESDFDEDDLDMAQSIWTWVIFSRLGRPLSVDELSVALRLRATIREEERFGLEWRKSISVGDGESLFDPKSEILRLCSPLLEIDENGFVHVVQYSVKEYFLTESASDTSTAKPAVLVPKWQRLTRLAISALRYMETDEVQSRFEGGQALPQISIKELDISLPFFSQSLLPIWDFLGDHSYRLGLLLTSNDPSDEKILQTLLQNPNLSRFHKFLHSPACVPWVIGTALLFGIRDISVLVTRIGLVVALAEEEVGYQKATNGVWELLVPHSKLRLWVETFYAFAKEEGWDFKFYEYAVLDGLWAGARIPASEQGVSKEELPDPDDMRSDTHISDNHGRYPAPKAHFASPAVLADLSIVFHHLREQASRSSFASQPLGRYNHPIGPFTPGPSPIAEARILSTPSSTDRYSPTISAFEVAATASERLKPSFSDQGAEYNRATKLFCQGSWDYIWLSIGYSTVHRVTMGGVETSWQKRDPPPLGNLWPENPPQPLL